MKCHWKKLITRFFAVIFLMGISLTNAHPSPINIIPSIQKSPNYASIVVNVNTGQVLFSRNAYQQRHPASLTKMMTLYLTFDALKRKRLYPLQKITVSKKASKQPKSNIKLKKGQKITIRTAIHAVIVKSANDAAIVLSEAVSGNTKEFVILMNKTAGKLKMSNTKFKNPHGLHDEGQYTTASDMAKLASALRKDFPRYYHLFLMKSFIYRGKQIYGHNIVLNKYKWADGLKTGYIDASGFNLATSTKNRKGNLVAIVMGGQTPGIRDNHMIKILNNAYARLDKRKKISKPLTSAKHHIKTGIFQYAPHNSNQGKSCWDVLNVH